ncbi:erythroid differentiation-related factor 1-like isoform X1 [Rhagoletis pomonella]|uniref:erythroid differentiation-related factor 1-like isoform X1 n=1 Tax=Rhagoletis pomonella TaxID=28610 RepID=UPI00177AB77C|nr:erythroid differentiation-related factor 1-like isoform X1 [Rhagoletis pomonella]
MSDNADEVRNVEKKQQMLPLRPCNFLQIELCQSIGPHELVEVKSKAVVKFSAVQVPVSFNRLQCNTNLNLPPSNWLTTSNNSGLHQALYQSPGFASFSIAHMFPDCVGEVDVVTDAENIKRLLKLPYTSKSAVSMIVHKVGNTLLLDEFDIQKYLLRKADDDWKWLRTFILEHILAYGEKDHSFCLKDKSREALQTKNLLSKFLYYSLKQSASEVPEQETQRERPALPITGPVLPEPKVEENVPDPKSSHVFNRNVLWTFEDIRMLIGTDMPIFGGPNRPCISLRLRDMAKPINVLTGIDYWLDNLMCNVPEVVMCYHIDGIVQKYEIIKTEDLPYLENSQFSPQVVRNVAQNILAFLKANATKAGHTYWLFKGRNDDVVKLYDLTTLCQKDAEAKRCEEKQENPFTVPVAMLLYTVARNMKNTTTQITPKIAGNIKALLDNCIKLLPKEKYPQIVTSSHYILSDLHLPAGIDPKAPKFDNSDLDSDTQSVYEEDEDDDMGSDDDCNLNDVHNELSENPEHSGNVAVKQICDTLKELNVNAQLKNGNRAPRAPSPLQAGIEDRCRISLEHISAGIACLKFFNSNEEKFIKESEVRAKDEEKLRILHEEQHPNMAKPFKPIPLPYESLSKHTANGELDSLKNSDDDADDSQTQSDDKNMKRSKVKRTKAKELKECQNVKTEANQGLSTLEDKRIGTKFNSQLFGSWNVHLKLLLLEKACLAYATYAEYYYIEQKYGSCLNAIYMASRCQQVVLKYMSGLVSQKSCLLGRAGDCFFQMAKNWKYIDSYLEQFNEESDIAQNINIEVVKDLNGDDLIELITPLANIEHLMQSSCKCYENAIECIIEGSTSDEDSKSELLRRLGNVRNELGLKYMYWAQEEYSKAMETKSNNLTDVSGSTENSQLKENRCEGDNKQVEKAAEPVYMKLAMKSYDCLIRGISAFSEVQDNVNLAFLYCNLGRFMRFRAHLYLPEENIDFVRKQKMFYNEAFLNYEKAKDVLGSRKSSSELWDLVNWELSTATFTLAKQLQDFSTADEATRAEIEKEVLDLLQKSLKLCDLEHPGSRQILYTYRSGLIHKRIASFHYSQLRNSCTDNSTIPKATLQLCKHHYERAASILEGLREASDHLVVQLERISLQEFLAETSNHIAQKIKHLQTALSLCLRSKVVFEHALTANTPTERNTTNDEFCKHMLLFESRLQNTLKTLIKMLLSGKDPKKLVELYKRMYMTSLTCKRAAGEHDTSVEELAQHFCNLLQQLNELELSHKPNAM